MTQSINPVSGERQSISRGFCQICGEPIQIVITGGKRRMYCSDACKAKSHRWRHGIVKKNESKESQAAYYGQLVIHLLASSELSIEEVQQVGEEVTDHLKQRLTERASQNAHRQ